MINNKIKVQIVLCVWCVFISQSSQDEQDEGLVRGGGRKGVGGGRPWLPPVARVGSRCPGLEGELWWC